MAPAFPLRIQQVVDHLRPGVTIPTLPAPLGCLLTPEALSTFELLSPTDQDHLIDVATRIGTIAGDDRDMVTAALLHDIGKAHGEIRVRVTDRVAKVVLERIRPSWLRRLAAQPSPPRFASGLWVLSRHAAAGAALARQWGYSERVAWLIAHHEDVDADDAGLRLLIDVDSGQKAPA